MKNKIFKEVYLFSDVDGTLSSIRNEIPVKNIEAIKYFTQNGGIFSVATGRFLGDIDVLEQVEINGVCILNNGACLYDYKKQEIISSEILPPNILDVYLKFLSSYDDIGLLIVSDEGYSTAVFDDKQRPKLLDSYRIKSIDELQHPFYKILFVLSHKMAEENGTRKIIKKLVDLNVEGVDYVQSGFDTIEIVPRGINKGIAFLKYCDMQGIEKGNTFFIGDSYNDIAMMQKAGFSACVGGSDKEVKDNASISVCNFKDGAVADFISIIENKIKNKI